LQHRVTCTQLRLLCRKLQILLRNKGLLYLLGTMANHHHNVIRRKRTRTIQYVRQH